MAIIKVECKCGREIKVDIKTIDRLSNENKRLKIEVKEMRAKLAAVEHLFIREEEKVAFKIKPDVWDNFFMMLIIIHGEKNEKE